MKKITFIRTALIAVIMVFAFNPAGWGQTSIPNTTVVTQNFDGMAATTTLPSNWKFHQSATPVYSSGTSTLGYQASSGSPSAGGLYNFGAGASDRAAGVMTSGSYASPNSLMGYYRNTNASNLTGLSISYDLERYRINTAAASVQFYYSTNGSTWTAVSSGDIAAATLVTGTSAYSFAPSGTPSSSVCGVVNKTGISISGLNIATNGDIYLRWNLNTTGASSQGIAIDNVSVTATFAAVGSTPPTLTAAVNPTVDAPFDVTFTEDATWRGAISGITIGGTTLDPSAYSKTASGKITFTPSASSLLQSAVSKSIVVSATGYADALVTQSIGVGVAAKLGIKTQPTAPASNGVLATQPAIYIQDQYGNTTTSTAVVTAAVGLGSWTLGGTSAVAAVSGTTTFSGLTASSVVAVTGATIAFTSPGLTPVSSNSFNIVATIAFTAAVGATVDAPFDVTFTDDAAWRAAITSITVGGTTLSASAYSVTAGKITFTPSVSTLLQGAGSKSIAVLATGYSTASVTQVIGAGAVTKFQLLMPGETAAAGTATGKTGTPTAQVAGTPFNATVNSTDQYWNLVSSTRTVAITCTDVNATLPSNAALVAGTGTYSLTFKTAATATVTATDQSGSPLTASTGASISVSAGVINKLQLLMPGETAAPGTVTGKTGTPTSQTSGTSFSVTVNAVDVNWNLVSSTNSIAITSSDANATLPSSAALVAGTKTYSVTFKTAGNRTVTATNNTNVTITANTSPSTTVNVGGVTKLQVLMPGETAAPGTSTGKTGTPTTQTAGASFSVTVNAVDANWNLVSSNTSTVAITSSDANAVLPSISSLVGGTGTFSVTCKTAAGKTITASDVAATLAANTGTSTIISAGAFSKLQLLLPGETAAPGTALGKTGSISGQGRTVAFNTTVNAVDDYWNIVTSSTHTIAITSTDASATLPANAALVSGVKSFSVTLNTLGSFTVTATDVTDNTKTSNTSGSVGITIIYCTPTTSTTTDGITNVTFNTINNTTTGLGGVKDYTAISTSVTQGSAYALSVSVNTGGNYTNSQKAWIDWNQDGTFDPSTEEYALGTVVNQTSGISSLCPLSITVPLTAVIGTTRMRVSSKYKSTPAYATPCETGVDGEFEDYTVVVAAAGATPALTATASPISLDNGSFTVTYPSNSAFNSAIATGSITMNNGAVTNTLTATSDYTLVDGQITFNMTSNSNAYLRTPGTYTISVNATGYAPGTVSQQLTIGASIKLGITIQPVTPLSNGATFATQPVVVVQDQFGNTTSSSATIDATVGAGVWTLGGTLTKAATSGTVTFTDFTATCSSAVTGANITFSSAGLTSVTSSNFNITALVAAPSAPSALTFGSVVYNGFTSSFTAPLIAPVGYVVLRRAGSAVTGVPVGGTVYTVGQTNIESGLNEVVYIGSSPWSSFVQTDLIDNTTYYYAVYSYNGAGVMTNYSSSLVNSQLTASVSTPTSNAASGILSSEFTANWDAVLGATSGYLLDVSTSSSFSALSPTSVIERFETGMPASYTNGSATLSTGIWVLTNTGGYSAGIAQLQNATGSAIVSPSFSNVTTVSFSVSASTASGALQVNYSTDGGSTWTPATGSPFTGITTSTVQKTATINSSSSNVKLQFKRTGATIYLDDITINYLSDAPSFVSGYNAKSIVGKSTTSSVVSGLDPNTSYFYRVRAVGGNSTSANSSTITALTKIATPTATAVSNQTGSSMIANWGAVSGATGYILNVYTIPTSSPVAISGSPFTIASGATLNKLISGLTWDVYYYTVQATDGVYITPASNEMRAVIDLATNVTDPSVSPKIYVSNGQLVVSDATDYAVYNVQGMEVANVKAASTKSPIALRSGVYLVKVAGKTQKVMIK